MVWRRSGRVWWLVPGRAIFHETHFRFRTKKTSTWYRPPDTVISSPDYTPGSTELGADHNQLNLATKRASGGVLKKQYESQVPRSRLHLSHQPAPMVPADRHNLFLQSAGTGSCRGQIELIQVRSELCRPRRVVWRRNDRVWWLVPGRAIFHDSTHFGLKIHRPGIGRQTLSFRRQTTLLGRQSSEWHTLNTK